MPAASQEQRAVEGQLAAAQGQQWLHGALRRWGPRAYTRSVHITLRYARQGPQKLAPLRPSQFLGVSSTGPKLALTPLPSQ